MTAAAEHVIPGHRAETRPGRPVNGAAAGFTRGAANGAVRPRERLGTRAPDYYQEAPQVEPLGGGWITVAVVIGIMAALIAIGGMVLSFRAVSTEMIPAFGVRWSWLVPVVVDLTVFVFSGVDLVLARMDMSHPLARWTVYGATAGTVYLNYNAAGTLPGRVAHVLMPSIWVVFIELMRHVVRRQTNLATGSRREPIPTSRWLVSPWPTLKLWRRMVLWRVNSYPRALEQEKERLGAIAAAREVHGRAWRWKISPLTRLQINLGEAGAGEIYQSAAAPSRRAQRQGRTRVPARAAEEDASYADPDAYAEEQEELAQLEELEVEYREQREPAEYTPRDTRAGVAPPRRPDTPAGRPRIPAPEPAFAAAAAQALSARLTEPVAADHVAVASIPAASAANHRATARIEQLSARPAAAPLNGSSLATAVPTRTPEPAAETGAPERPAPPRGPAHAQTAPYQQPAPPPLRRSVRESEMLTAAREVERWRGQPSATRISRELGIGMTLATSLANALREEEGLPSTD